MRGAWPFASRDEFPFHIGFQILLKSGMIRLLMVVRPQINSFGLTTYILSHFCIFVNIYTIYFACGKIDDIAYGFSL